MFHMREYYVIKTQRRDPDTPMYMEALSGETSEEYFKSMDDEIQSLMIRDTWENFQVSHLLITMLFQEHGPSSARVNRIGHSGYSRQDIV